jgi:murein L,D-transpeptidase YcbB/YkuD
MPACAFRFPPPPAWVRLVRALSVPVMFWSLATLAGISSCGGPSTAHVSDSLRTRVRALDDHPIVVERELLEPAAVRAYYAKHPSRAWPGDRVAQVVEAIRSVERDGLTPSDYHLETIQSLADRKERSAGADADLDLLLTDAVAGMIDHLRYGRVRPVTLNPEWNVDPRDGAPPLDSLLGVVAADPSTGTALARMRPQHFIYQGLVAELERLRGIERSGGWSGVSGGPALRPGARNPRAAELRRRLTASGELTPVSAPDSTRYDTTLVGAVRRFQRSHRLNDDGVVDAGTVAALNVPIGQQIAQVRVNLERARWVLGELSDQDEFLLVNLPAFKTYLIRGGTVAWEARVQIGQEARQTPSFRARLRTVVFNPSWTVPPTILAEDVLEGIRKGKDVIAEKRLVVLDAQGQEVDPGSVDWDSADPKTFPYTLRQPPGPGSALGRIKFEFPNPYSIYLHDTPHRELFDSNSRTFSSGCIRVENPDQLAALLLEGQDGWNPAKIQQAIDTKETQNVQLARRPPVLIVYWTVTVGASGVRYGADVYSLDPPLAAALGEPPAAVTAGRQDASSRP